eukprot:scaffold926_cov408-Prasinococcus_capsulatus_cf.AAC.40
MDASGGSEDCHSCLKPPMQGRAGGVAERQWSLYVDTQLALSGAVRAGAAAAVVATTSYSLAA